MNIDGDLIGLVSAVLFMLIPIVAILTHHQRKMAEVVHGRAPGQTPEGVQQALVDEIRAMRQALNAQTMALDSLVRELRPRTPEPMLADRLAEEARS